MGSLDSALSAQKKREAGEPLDSFLKRVFKFGRPGKTVLFDAPGLEPTELRHEPLDGDATEEAQLAAYAHVVKKLGDNLKGRVEDTDLYDERVLLEVLHRGVKRTDQTSSSNGVTYYFPAAASPDEYKKLTNEQRTYLYRQHQLVVAEFSPTRAQSAAMKDIEGFCRQCANAAKESGDGFLFLASLSWQEAITLVGVLGAQLSNYLPQSATRSSSVDTSELSHVISTGTTDFYTESPSTTSWPLEKSDAIAKALENSQTYSENSQSEAEDLANKLGE